MKVLIWILCIFANASITTIIKQSGVILGGIPTAILFGLTMWCASIFCKKWDEHKSKKQSKAVSIAEDEANNDKISFCRKCGEPLIDSSKFCRKCGAEIVEEVIASEETTETAEIDLPDLGNSTPENVWNTIVKIKTEEAVENLNENKKEKRAKSRFCKFSGGQIDTQTKKCIGCGKQYFKGIKVSKSLIIILTLSILILTSVILNIVQFIKADELTETITSQNSTISSQKNKINLLNEKSDYYDMICRELSYGNIGYAANNFRTSESVIVVDKNETNRKFTLTANWPNNGNVSVAYSGSAAKVSFDNNSWGTSTSMTVKPKTEGVTVVKFSNNVDSKTFKIIIIVTN